MDPDVLNKLIAIAALAISFAALVGALWSHNSNQESEFRYNAYNRLGAVARHIDRENLRTQERLNELKNPKNHENTTDFGLYEALVAALDAVTKADRAIFLDQVAFEEKDITRSRELASELQKEFENLKSKLNQSPINQEAKEDILKFIEKAQNSWNELSKIIDTAIKKMAADIRR